MAQPRANERILIVESDPAIRDLLARQALTPLGYQVKIAPTASAGIQLSLTFAPDLIIANLRLPDLSAKDLLVALNSQGVEIPIILVADKGMENDVIQAFRLGATDYLAWPVRDTEVVSAVERALKNIRARREREELEKQVKQTNAELQRRVRELTTIFSLGKAVTSITDQHALLNKIMDDAIFVSEAERGWLLLKDEKMRAFVLRTYKNMPKTVVTQLNQPFDDGISQLVAMSGEVLSIHGSALQRFKIAQWGQAAMVIPIKAKKEVIGLLTVVRKDARPFDKGAQNLLEAIADYASISLVNSRLFQALEDRASRLEKAVQDVRKAEDAKAELFSHVRQALQAPLTESSLALTSLAGQQPRLKLSREQTDLFNRAAAGVQRSLEIAGAMSVLHDAAAPKELTTVDLNTLARQAITNQQQAAQRAGMALLAELPTERCFVQVDSNQVLTVFAYLIQNSIKFSPSGGQITIRVDVSEAQAVKVEVRDQGVGIQKKDLPNIFDRFFQADDPNIQKAGGVGIGLAVVKEVVTAHNGKVWAESQPGKGTTIGFSLPKVSV